MASNNYAHPEALVETDWLAQHLKDDGIRIVESNEDILLYDTGHIPGAVHIDWRADLQDPVIRDFADEALAQSKAKKPLIDVRSPGEYKGEITHMPEYPQEGVLRGGHIPGAKSVPWKTAVKDDGTFKAAADLEKIYIQDCGVNQSTDTVVYCRIGERSSHTWFVLTYLLGLDNVRNYDGSWTEWGNKVGAPIEKSA